jgi:hypothetical protein
MLRILLALAAAAGTNGVAWVSGSVTVAAEVIG